jgi:hypothetical protein
MMKTVMIPILYGILQKRIIVRIHQYISDIYWLDLGEGFGVEEFEAFPAELDVFLLQIHSIRGKLWIFMTANRNQELFDSEMSNFEIAILTFPNEAARPIQNIPFRGYSALVDVEIIVFNCYRL